jgi:hypothetical protein
MYTGTLIQDLMNTVARAEQSAEHKRIADEVELRRLYELPLIYRYSEQVLAGAA